MHDMPHVFGSVSELVVDTAAFRTWAHGAQLKARGITAETIPALMAAYDRRPLTPTVVGSVAVIDIIGPITPKSSWLSCYYGCAAVQDLQQQFQAAVDDAAVKTIVFRVDSPGGDITLIPEFGDQIFAARVAGKAILAVADTMIASAAYWIASQADTIYASATAQLGSIGVYCEHDDISGMLAQAGIAITLIAHGDHKTEGNPYEPLSDEARAYLQTRVDEIGGWFEAAVARGRHVQASDVLANFGQGRMFRGKAAIAAGLADKAGTIAQVMGKLTKGRLSAGVMAQIDVPVVAAAADMPTTDSGCASCSEGCGCDSDECPDMCPDCDPSCPCRDADDDDAAATAAAATAAMVLSDEQAILAALSRR